MWSQGTDSRYTTLSTLLPKFPKLNLRRMGSGNGNGSISDNICATIRLNSAKFHKSCLLRYSTSRADRQPSTTDEVQDEGHALRSKRPRLEQFSEECMFCQTFVKGAPLHAAGLKHATTFSTNSDNLTSFTDKLRVMATTLCDSSIVSKLLSGDVNSNELYYHLPCYTNYCRKYDKALRLWELLMITLLTL